MKLRAELNAKQAGWPFCSFDPNSGCGGFQGKERRKKRKGGMKRKEEKWMKEDVLR